MCNKCHAKSEMKNIHSQENFAHWLLCIIGFSLSSHRTRRSQGIHFYCLFFSSQAHKVPYITRVYRISSVLDQLRRFLLKCFITGPDLWELTFLFRTCMSCGVVIWLDFLSLPLTSSTLGPWMPGSFIPRLWLASSSGYHLHTTEIHVFIQSVILSYISKYM